MSRLPLRHSYHTLPAHPVERAARDHAEAKVRAGDNRWVAYDVEPPALLGAPADHAAAPLLPVAADADAALRADVRRVVGLLGESWCARKARNCWTSWSGCER